MTNCDDAPFDPVPRELATLLDPAWLTWALDDIVAGERVVAVDTADASRTLAQKVRFTVTFENEAGARRMRPYCVKAHFGEDGPGTMVPEARFYRHLAARVGVRTPHASYVGIDDVAGRALVVMDDVVSLGGRFLDAHQPYSIETTRDSLDQLARLHASTWGNPAPDGCEWLVHKVREMIDLFPVEALQRLLDDGRAAGLAPELHSGSNLRTAVCRTAELPNTCVLHGDTHSGNVYLDVQGRACWLDWQVVQPGNWATDVSYHLGTVLDIEDRRAHEVELLRHYLDRLASYGADAPAFDEAWDHYTRGFSFGFFLWAITRISSRAVVLVHMPRLGAALSDHGTYRLLDIS